MPSIASTRFEKKLTDIQALLEIHVDIAGSHPGRRKSKLRVLHKSSVALLVAAWETYIEALLEEGVMFTSGFALIGGDKNIQYAELRELIRINVQQATKRLNTANSDNVLILFRNALGIEDIRIFWGRPGMGWKKAYKALDQLLVERHSIVHGATTDPEYSKRDVILWQKFLCITVARTDDAVRECIEALTGKSLW